MPLSKRRLESVLPLIQTNKIELLVSYQNRQPSAVCSYYFNHKIGDARILDFCIHPLFPQGGYHLLDFILEKARNVGIRKLSCLVPLSFTASLDVLGEYLFNPEKGILLMKLNLSEPPDGNDIQIIEPDDKKFLGSPLLPFREPFQLRSIIRSMFGKWHFSFSTKETSNHHGFDVFLSDTARREAWIFNSQPNHAPSFDGLCSALKNLFYRGIRVVYTETEVGLQHRAPFDNNGFLDLNTQFEMTYYLEY